MTGGEGRIKNNQMEQRINRLDEFVALWSSGTEPKVSGMRNFKRAFVGDRDET